MSNFWENDHGDDLLEGSTGEFDAGGGNMEPLPEGTNVLAHPEDAKWDSNSDDDEFINIKWRVQKPDEYANRVIFHKLWVSDDDPNAKDAAKKREKAKRMLAAIDANAGGKLARKANRPTDNDLMLALANKAMVLNLGIWEMGDGKGNWVRAVSPKAGWTDKAKSQPAAKAQKDNLDDDEVPF